MAREIPELKLPLTSWVSQGILRSGNSPYLRFVEYLSISTRQLQNMFFF